MNRQDLVRIHGKLVAEAHHLMVRKNKDYAGKGGEEPFANFTRVEAMGICSTTKGFLVRLTDKLSRLSSFADSGTFAVTDESLRDTVLDIINYAVLLYAYETEERDRATPDQ